MLDINQATVDRLYQRHDPEGHMHDLEPWSREIAKRRARDEGLEELSEAQWRVIYTLRGCYRKNGRPAGARELIRLLEEDFRDEGGRRYLYELFSGGPISQGCRLAGVPAPPYSSDPSFGWTA